MLDAGADLVQLYTGYIYEGPKLVREICRALIDDAGSKPHAQVPETPDSAPAPQTAEPVSAASGKGDKAAEKQPDTTESGKDSASNA